MGLDLVELMMRFQEEFETDIPDEILGTFYTPKDLINHLLTHPKIAAKYVTREAIRKKAWLIIEDEIGIEMSKFDEDSDFIKDMHID